MQESMTGGSRAGTASPVADQAKQLARAGTEQVKELSGTAMERARREIDSRRERIAGEVAKLADVLEKQGSESEAAGPVMGLVASGVRRLSTTLRERSAEDLLRGIARSPTTVLAGSFAIGFLAFRLFKD
jgi:hypothetical protein